MKLTFEYEGHRKAFYTVKKVGVKSYYKIFIYDKELRQITSSCVILYDSTNKSCNWKADIKNLYTTHKINHAISESILYLEEQNKSKL
jgi:hypothetical protein